MSGVDNFKDLVKPFFETDKGQKYVEDGISGKGSVVVNLDDLAEWNSDIAETLVVMAVKYGIKGFEQALREKIVVYGINPEGVEIGFRGEFIPFVKIREIASKHVGQLVRIRGLVNRTAFIKPMYIEAVFKCRECGFYTQPILQESPLTLTLPPKKCESCETRVTYDVVPEMSTFVDSQEFSIQELHEDISGRIPQRIRMILFKKYLINKVRCGDLVEIMGVVRLQPSYRRTQKTRFNLPYIEVYSLNKKSKDPESIEISKEEEEEILALANQSNVYETMIDNVAPSLFGMRRCKEACLLALFGGVNRKKKDIRIRGNIHVLMVGDPATGKSQLLQSVADLSPRGMYATGRGTTAAGLTAALNRDEFGEWVIEAGVLVLSDNGVACIDEIEKMRNEDRVNIHEAMAQQTVTIDKGGLHATLMARTAVISAANPLMGRYVEDQSILENLSNFPPSLFSRFDLIFILIDKPQKDFDVKVVEHILRGENRKVKVIDRELFRKYIAYAKRLNPKLSGEAEEKLKKYFLSIRKSLEADGSKTIPITYRQFEAMMRLCEARARALLKKEADAEDAEAVIKLFNAFLEDVKFDVESIETGKVKSLKDAYRAVYRIIKELQNEKGVPHSQLVAEARGRGVPETKIGKVIVQMLSDGSIFRACEEPENYYRTMS